MPFLPRKRQSRDFSASEKLHAIQRINNGESKASVARHIDVPESTLRGWCKKEEKYHSSVEMLMLKSILVPSPKKLNRTRNDEQKRNSLDVNHQGSSPHNRSQWPQKFGLDLSQRNGSSSPTPPLQLKSSKNNGLYKPYEDSVVNASRSTNQQLMAPNNLFCATQSPVLPSRSASSLPPPTPKPMASPTISSTLSDPVMLWTSADWNQVLMGRMADGPVASESKINFNNNYLPEELSIRRGHAVQPIETEMKHEVSSSKSEANPSIINTERVVCGDKSADLNKDNTESETDVMEPWEAIQCAEKFSRWFETYSDPTITTQDVLCFEKLLGKVRKMIERKNSPNAQSSRIRKRK